MVRERHYTLHIVRTLSRWLPPLALSGFILSASGGTLSGGHTISWLERLFIAIGHPLAPEPAEVMNVLVRKFGHVSAYALLGALWFRAVRGDDRGWQMRWAATAVALVIVVASLDEWRQSFFPSRSGRWQDVVVDACGAVLALMLIRARGSLLLRFPES